MKIAYGFIVGFFVTVLGVLIYSSYQKFDEKSFDTSNREFIKEFIRDFSVGWKISDIEDRVSKEFLFSVKEISGGRNIDTLRRLGELEEIYGMKLYSYHKTKTGDFGIFHIKTRFENATALVVISIIEREGKSKVMGFSVNPLGIVKQKKYET